MPELPEVETVARGLRTVLPGRRIVGVRLGKTDFIEDPAAIQRELPGRAVAGVERYGKFLLFDLEPANASPQKLQLLIHLGMTGQLLMCDRDAPVAPHTHAFFALDDGRELRYRDVRRFGSMRILADGARAGILGPLGLDPLEAAENEFSARLAGRRARIKALLLDQRVLRGMGNIYTDESLWRARIHPMRLGANLTREELHKLYAAMHQVLEEAIRFRGSSVSDYVDSGGRRGKYQQRHRVYQREGEKCMRCGATISRAIVAGRSSYFCPRCQRAPRKGAKRAKHHEKRRALKRH
jgi:formamidopyrimidine-DNA glycosylase